MFAKPEQFDIQFGLQICMLAKIIRAALGSCRIVAGKGVYKGVGYGIQSVVSHKTAAVSVCDGELLGVVAEGLAALHQCFEKFAGAIVVGNISDILGIDKIRRDIIKEQIRSLQSQREGTVMVANAPPYTAVCNSLVGVYAKQIVCDKSRHGVFLFGIVVDNVSIA